MKKRLIVLAFVLLVPLIYAASIELAESYGPSEILSGTITFKLDDASADSNFTAAFDSLTRNTKLIDFLNNASADYNCTPKDCSSTYSASSPSLTKKISNGYIALSISSGKNVRISQIAFNISGSSDTKSCGFAPSSMDILDDGTTDWQYMEPDDAFCEQLAPSDKYNANVAEATYYIVTEPYCEKINLITGKRFRLAADIIGGSVESNIYLALTDGIKREECEINNTDGLQTCEVNFTASEGEYYLCIYSNNDDSDTIIKGETEQPTCGQFGLSEFNCNETSIDYALYNQPAFFRGFTEKTVFDTIAFSEFTNQELEIYIQDYLDTNYGSNCSAGCIIPIKVTSNQELTFSDLNLKYLTSLGAKTEKNFYSAEKNPAKIRMAEQELSLDSAGFITPPGYGNYSLSILLDNNLLDKKEITIAKVPIVKSFSPLLVPAATSTRFIVLAESPKGNSIVSYEWDFGDNGFETTTAPYVDHVYGLGDYKLTLKVTDSEGLSSQRIFLIKAEEPKAIVNLTIEEKKQNLKELEKVLSSIPKWYFSLVSINVDELEAKLAEFEASYKLAGADYVSLKLGLDELFVPSRISEERIETPMHSEPKADLIAAIDNSEADEQTNEKIKLWNNANAVITASYIIKSAVEDDKSESLATEYKIEVKSKGEASFDNIYLIIDSANPMVFKSNYSEYSKQKVENAWGFIITLNNEPKTIEFAVAGNHSADEFIIFVSPSLEILKSGEEVICGDSICDKARGESYESCPLDCKKPYGKAIIWIIIVIAVVAAGLLGIWKYYAVKYDIQLREKLFKPKEDFYKLSFFISNEINQGKDDREIKEKLEKAGWKNSQIDYALRKTKQSRTALQKKSLLAYAQKELYSGKSEDDIRNKLIESGWKNSLVSWALRKAKK